MWNDSAVWRRGLGLSYLWCFALFQEQRSSFNPSEVTQAVTSRDPECIDVVNPKSHYDVLARILLLYAKLNRGVRYVQGMNELLAPLYYLFAQDPLNGHHAEDSRLCYIFLVFVSLNVEPDRIFRSTSHIHHRIFIYDIIRKCKRNSHLHCHLASLNIKYSTISSRSFVLVYTVYILKFILVLYTA